MSESETTVIVNSHFDVDTEYTRDGDGAYYSPGAYYSAGISFRQTRDNESGSRTYVVAVTSNTFLTPEDAIVALTAALAFLRERKAEVDSWGNAPHADDGTKTGDDE